MYCLQFFALWPNCEIGFLRLPDWFFDLLVFCFVLPDCLIGSTGGGGGGGGGVNCGVFINLVCLPAKGSSTEDPKMSFKHVLFKGIHTVFFWGRAGSRPDFGISV